MTATQRRLAILLLALTAYWPTLKLGFFWDDHVMIEANPALREWSIKNLKHDFSTDVFDGHGDPYYRPAQTLANRVDYTIWGLRPFGYHLTNFAFHAANSALLGELIIALGLGPLAALLAGCLFAVHPIGVEQLMIIAGRAELMSFCFMLASLLCFLQEGPLFVLAGSAAYVLALFSKESAIVTPALFILILWFLKKRRSLFNRLWIYGGLAVPYLIARFLAVGSKVPSMTASFMTKFYIEAFPKILTVYVRLILVPWNLHSHRMIPHLSHFWFLYLAAWAGLWLWLIRKKNRLGVFFLGWFIVTLLPKTPPMIIGNFTLDHWGYPAALGILGPLACGFARLWEGRHIRWRYRTALLFFPILAAFALLTQLNVELRGTDEKMYRWALNFTESHPIQYNLGVLLLTTGRAQEAIPYFENVRALYPENADNQRALAIAYWKTGHPRLARRLLEKLIKENPSYTPAGQTLQQLESTETK